MLFCVIVVTINASDFHSSLCCLLPPSLPHPQRPKGSGGCDQRAAGGFSESAVPLQSSHSETGGLRHVSLFKTRVDEQNNLPMLRKRRGLKFAGVRSCRGDLEKAKLGSPKAS